jgi:hypothetical protein
VLIAEIWQRHKKTGCQARFRFKLTGNFRKNAVFALLREQRLFYISKRGVLYEKQEKVFMDCVDDGGGVFRLGGGRR